jgi:hypothetical protein
MGLDLHATCCRRRVPIVAAGIKLVSRLLSDGRVLGGL